ncbi:MAG: DUF1365 domain-containing protein [Phycisphaerales bacterium]
MSADATPFRSAIYEGVVRHRRVSPVRHEFEFPLFMAYLDLGEIERVFSLTRWWSFSRWAPACFLRADYLAPADVPLDEAVRRRVERELGWRPSGPIRVLTHLRCFGYCFNPVSFYYCFSGAREAADERLLAIVAEITNTPWRERHAYVLDRREAMEEPSAGAAAKESARWHWRFRKVFHVSPLMPMELENDWAFSRPGERLAVHMNLLMPPGVPRDGSGPFGDDPPAPRVFDATLTLQRRELTPAAMRSVLLRYPFMTARVIGRIHWEALRTWLRGARVHPHPARSLSRESSHTPAVSPRTGAHA